MTQVIDLGKLRFHFAGEFNPLTTYELNDVVKYGGNIYCYIYPLRQAGTRTTDTACWALMLKGIDFKGVYAPSTDYKIGDGVAYGGKVYIAVADSTGVVPPNAESWSQFADGIQFEGLYSGTAAYQKNDLVTYGGGVYIAKQDTVGNDPTVGAFWSKFVDGVSPKSVYNEATAYVPNDLVAYGANIYRAKSNTKGKIPTDEAFWEMWTFGVSYVGVWTAETKYHLNDLVTYGGGVYIAKQDTIGSDPTVEAFWSKFVEGVSPKGVYNEATAYAPNDLVTYGANTYRAKSNTKGKIPTDEAYWAMWTLGVRYVGAWVEGTKYYLNDIVTYGGQTFIAMKGHPSLGFAADLGSGKWQKFNGGIRWKGAFSTGAQYLQNDVVADGMSSYIVLEDYLAGASAVQDREEGKLHVLALGQANVPDPAGGSKGKVLTVGSGGGYTLTYTKPEVRVANALWPDIGAPLVDGFTYTLDSTGGSFQLTLPATPSAGHCVKFVDGGSNLSGFPVTILRNGSNINEISDDVLLDVNNIFVSFTYINDNIGWRIN